VCQNSWPVFLEETEFPYYIRNSNTIIQRIYRRRWSVWLCYTGQCHSPCSNL